MGVSRSQVVKEAQACLGRDAPAGELVDCVSRNFPDVQANREGDDLVIKGGQKFLVVKRTGPDRFMATKNVAALPRTRSMQAPALNILLTSLSQSFRRSPTRR